MSHKGVKSLHTRVAAADSAGNGAPPQSGDTVKIHANGAQGHGNGNRVLTLGANASGKGDSRQQDGKPTKAMGIAGSLHLLYHPL